MDHDFYLGKFNAALLSLDKKDFDKLDLRFFLGVVLNSVAIKIYKPDWSGDKQNPLTAESRIFFSIWINDKTIGENKLYYNIHALKLRKLIGYKITSRDFAERFRKQFIKQQEDWPNTDTRYGPLTLMQGWEKLEPETMENDIVRLAKNFLKISPIIDETLNYYKASR
jgi:hypothetical protein